MEVIAGEHTLETEVSQHGARFKLDFSQVSNGVWERAGCVKVCEYGMQSLPTQRGRCLAGHSQPGRGVGHRSHLHEFVVRASVLVSAVGGDVL